MEDGRSIRETLQGAEERRASCTDHMTTWPMRMEEGQSHMTKRMLTLSLEIIYLLTGEECEIVTSSEPLRASSSHKHGPSPITGAPHYSLTPERKKKILENNKRIIHLVTGEEWCYLEGHKDLYKDAMMGDQQTITLSAGGQDVRDTSEGQLMSHPDDPVEDNGITQCSSGGLPVTENIHHTAHTTDRVTSPSSGGEAYGKSQAAISDIHLKTQLSVPMQVKQFSCAECGKCFSNKGNLRKHQIIHTGERPFSCLECGKCFNQKAILLVHQRIHTGEGYFPCAKCGKCFSANQTLLKHEMIHSGERPFSCTQCGKCFNRKNNLLTHERSHSGIRPFSCSECGNCFSRKENLLTHKRSHSGERPFSCSECGKCFRRKEHLLTHLRSHTGERPFSCLICGKSFSEKRTLISHKMSHTGK